MPIQRAGASETDYDLRIRVTPAQYDSVRRPTEVDVAFVYCLDVEEDAVRQRFFAGPRTDFRPYAPSYRRFYRGSSKHKGYLYQLVGCKSSDQGSLNVLTALQDLYAHFSPKVTCLVGIAGALDATLDVGDVLLASAVYWYERGKSHAASTDRELRPFTLPRRVWNLLDAVLSDLRKDRNAPSVEWGTFGTGDKVIASELSDVRDYLVTVDRKVAAVELESGGFFHYFENAPFRPEGDVWIVVKGISDHADEAKKDSGQALAAANSARSAFYIATGLIREHARTRPNSSDS